MLDWGLGVEVCVGDGVGDGIGDDVGDRGADGGGGHVRRWWRRSCERRWRRRWVSWVDLLYQIRVLSISANIAKQMRIVTETENSRTRCVSV
jgi:hypothetical protein